MWTTAKVLSTTKRVEIINKKNFVIAILNKNNETFVIYIATSEKLIIIPIYLSHQTQIVLLMSEKTKNFVRYFNFSNIFSSNSIVELPKHISINDYTINLVNNM